MSQDPDSEPLQTMQFTINPDGTLVDEQGDLFLDQLGNPVIVTPPSTPVIIRGGSMKVYVYGGHDLEDLDHSHRKGRFFEHSVDKKITYVTIVDPLGSPPPKYKIVKPSRNTYIQVDYE